MEVMPGYKQTDLGIIPEEWYIETIQQLLNDGFIIGHLDGNHGELYPRSHEFKSHGVPYIGANDFASGNVIFDGCKFLSPERAAQFRKGVAKDGDVLFAHNATVGPVAMLRTNERFVILSTTATYFRCDLSKLNNSYLKETLQSQYFVRQYQAVMAQSTRFQVPITTQRKLSLVIAPIAEQRAIAAALSDVNALLGGLERLIAKKRDLKQAAMQQLLTGQIRFPGFSGEWEVKRLGELADVLKGDQLHSDDTRTEGDVPHYNGGISPSSYTDKANAAADTIAISEGGNSCGYVQFITQPFWCGGHCYAVVPKGIDKRFLYHALKGRQQAIMGLRVGSGLPNVQKTALKAFSFEFPKTVEEQTAIATVLTDMDAELAALEARCEKTRALKTGMMQELLTGKTRLI
jgi:type I restriction enzyme S subunit